MNTHSPSGSRRSFPAHEIPASPAPPPFRGTSTDRGPSQVVVQLLQAGEELARIDLSVTPLVLGSSSDCDVSVPEPSVSRHHARLSLKQEVVHIEDLGSTNGTTVNGETFAGLQPLSSGDILQLGEWRVEIRIERPNEIPRQAPRSCFAEGARPTDAGPRPRVRWGLTTAAGVLGFFGLIMLGTIACLWKEAKRYRPQSSVEHVQLTWTLLFGRGHHGIKLRFLESGDPRCGAVVVPPIGSSESDLTACLGPSDNEALEDRGGKRLTYLSTNRLFGGYVRMVQIGVLDSQVLYVTYDGTPCIHPRFVQRALAVNSGGAAWKTGSAGMLLAATERRLTNGGIADAVWMRHDEQAIAVLSHLPDDHTLLEICGDPAGSQVLQAVYMRAMELEDAYAKGYSEGRTKAKHDKRTGWKIAPSAIAESAEQAVLFQGIRDGYEGGRKRLMLTSFIQESLERMSKPRGSTWASPYGSEMGDFAFRHQQRFRMPEYYQQKTPYPWEGPAAVPPMAGPVSATTPQAAPAPPTRAPREYYQVTTPYPWERPAAVQALSSNSTRR